MSGSPTSSSFFDRDSEIARLFRAIDWSRHPLGPPESWDESLKLTARLLFLSRFPMSLSWGDHATILYNDAYIEIIGDRHPSAFAADFREVWPNPSDLLKKSLEKVRSGESVYNEDMPLPILRGGRPHQAYVTFSYSPLRDQQGRLRGHVCTVIDTTKRVEAEKSLRLAREHMSGALESATRIIETIPQGIWRTNPDGQADYCSQRFCDMVGYPREDLLGSGWASLIHPDDQPNVLKIWQQSCLEKKPVSVEFRVRLRDGTYRWFLSLGNPYFDSAGEIVKFYGTWTDIHEGRLLRNELELRTQALETSKEEAERANQLKSAFLANMSHEIRTPLGAMLGFADLLRDPNLSATDQNHYLDILSRNGQQLAVIINDILDLSKVEAGHLTLEFLATRPVEIAQDTVDLLRVKANERNLDLQYERDSSTPEQVVSDPIRVRQVLLNLVGNAIKFTPHGQIRLRSFGTLGANGQRQVSYEVQDTGIGIAEHQRKKIFEDFVQADGSMTRRFGGTGLGLALSQKLAIALGGQIELKTSTVGKGSCFVFTFSDVPAQALPVFTEPRSGPTPATKLTNALAGLSILVVDDAPDNQQLIGRLLTKQGAHVESAANGLEGCQKALKGQFDLVLMDIQMPLMDGYTATSRLREQGFTKPIIALTAHAMQDVRSKSLNVGCTDHLTKPINRDDLISKIYEYTHTQSSAG